MAITYIKKLCKYQLESDYSTVIYDMDLSDFPEEFKNDYFSISAKYDRLSICVKPGYAWDGASGPTIDTKNTVAASMIHDILYQFMRETDNSDYSYNRRKLRMIIDRNFKKMLIDNAMAGQVPIKSNASKFKKIIYKIKEKLIIMMIKIRAWAWYGAVRAFAKKASVYEPKKKYMVQ